MRLFGLLVSPNRGLLLFSPVFLLLLAVPVVWRRWPSSWATLLGAFGVGAMGYVLLVANLHNWGAFG